MELTKCYYCSSKNLEHIESGYYKRIIWDGYKCLDCEREISDEPDWDSEPGGYDDY